MTNILTAFVLLFTLSARAEKFEASIYAVSRNQAASGPHLVKLSNGRVLFVGDKAAAMAESMQNEDMLQIELNEKQQLLSLKAIRVDLPAIDNNSIPAGSFNPTVILGYDAAIRLYNNLNKNYKNNTVTQCYNRAHIWAYEEFRKSGLQSQKTFVFFSDQFILINKFEWWFHVAPMILVDEGGHLNHRVLDHQYSDRPLLIKEWTGQWVKERPCSFINKYSHFAVGSKQGDCYLMNVPMFFWQPKDLEDFEATGFARTQFIPWELQHAYKEAFQ